MNPIILENEETQENVLLERTPQRSFINRIFWKVVVVFATLLSLTALIPLLWLVIRALTYRLYVAVEYQVVTQYEALWRFLAGLGQDPPPEPSVIEKVADHVTDMIRRIDSNIIAIGVIGIITFLAVVVSTFFVLRSLRKISYRIRGIQFEALRPGSTYTKEEIPNFQVRVGQPGLFSASHVGYAVRIGPNYMAVPHHVIRGQSTVLLTGPKGRCIVDVVATQSRMYTDLSYCWVDERVWTTLGISIAKLQPYTSRTVVRCYGQLGYTSGSIYKTSLSPGIIAYEGSTENGTSGAAYVLAGKVLGLHSAHNPSSNMNFGVSSNMLLTEYAMLMKPEGKKTSATLDHYTGDAPVTNVGKGWSISESMAKKEQEWNDVKLKNLATAAYSHDWTNPPEIDYNANLDWGSDDEESAKVKRPVFQAGAFVPATVTLQHQGAEGEMVETGLMNVNLVEMVGALSKRVEELEKFCASITEPVQRLIEDVDGLKNRKVVNATAKAVAKVTCECGVEVAEGKLENHILNAHPKPIVQMACPDCHVMVAAFKMDAHIKNSHPPSTKVKCSFCEIQCKDSNRLANHIANVHRVMEVKPESAFSSDETIKVATRPFLGRSQRPRSNSPRMRPQQLSRTSNVSTKSQNSPSLEAVLSLMTASLQNIEKRLNAKPPGTDGQSSGIGPN
ncbi:hypothetical protein 1 [Hubei sobemo-like virus 27]|uniref:hypothetical protein 1 n=1 Tax=Hubei sobemo-like virus 27 TaxID=1923213 RepID=UPI00090BFEF6|nr:hypothetical protein 1 [Hubei sobemo-like virus 27]APG75922.1 hypothetical protein 1 [Hubei sobemo-like virus 27]